MNGLVEQLRVLDELHRAGSLSDAEFEAAKAQLLGQRSDGAVEMRPEPSSQELLLLQNELARIDREWEMEREKYKVVGRYRSSIPESGSGTSAGIAITIFGGVWTAMALFMAIGASSSGAPSGMTAFFWIFPLFGVFFIVTGLSKGAEMNQKADAYTVAEREYQNRRAQVLAKMRAIEAQ